MEHHSGNRQTLGAAAVDGAQLVPFLHDLVMAKVGADEGNAPAPAVSKAERTSQKIVAAYGGLLLGCLCRDSPGNQALLAHRATSHTLASIVRLLQEFVLYQRETGVNSAVDLSSLSSVIDVLEQCRLVPAGSLPEASEAAATIK